MEKVSEHDWFWVEYEDSHWPFCTDPKCYLPAVVVDRRRDNTGTFWCWRHGMLEQTPIESLSWVENIQITKWSL